MASRNKHQSCNRRGLHTLICAKPPVWTIRIVVAGFVVQLLACGECHAKAPASLGAWEPL